MATLITNATELQAMSADLAGDYELANDIDASATSGWNAGAGFVPIGDTTNRFTGSLDGKVYTITGLYINRPSLNWVGLFGYTDGAVISNLSLTTADITGDDYVGILVGLARSTTISECHSSGAVDTAGYNAGGLVGYTSGATITNSSSSAAVVVSTGYVGGGLIGWQIRGSTTECFATGNITSVDKGTGGLIGFLQGTAAETAYVTDCYATGDVIDSGTGTGGAGGLIGGIQNGYVVLSNCFSNGAVQAPDDPGGLISSCAVGATVTDCFWDTTTSGQATSAGGTGKTTAEMKLWATFEGWNITAHTVDIDGYPYLAWQLTGNSPIWYIYEAAKYGPVEIVALEAIRNIEMAAMGRIYVDEEGNLCYENRYARQL